MADLSTVEAAAHALAEHWARQEPASTHGQLCPVWTHKRTVAACDCWILPRARDYARIVLDTAEQGAATAAAADPVVVPDALGIALHAFPEDDERHWQVQAYLFNLLAHKASSRADTLRRRANTSASTTNGGTT